MRFRAFARLSLRLAMVAAMFHSTGAMASEDAAEEAVMTEAIAAQEASFAVMSEEEAIREVLAEVAETERRLDEAVQAGQISPEQAQGVQAQTQNVRDATQRRGFRKKLVEAFKAIGSKAKSGSRVVIRGVGYGGEAVAFGFFAPIWLASGFANGAIVGDRTLQGDGAKVGVALVSAGAGVYGELEALAIANNAPIVFGTAFPVSLTIAAVNNIVICREDIPEDDSPYCKNIGKIHRALTTSAYSGGKKGGNKFRRFLGKVFKFGRRGNPQPPAVEPQPEPPRQP